MGRIERLMSAGWLAGWRCAVTAHQLPVPSVPSSCWLSGNSSPSQTDLGTMEVLGGDMIDQGEDMMRGRERRTGLRLKPQEPRLKDGEGREGTVVPEVEEQE